MSLDVSETAIREAFTHPKLYEERHRLRLHTLKVQGITPCPGVLAVEEDDERVLLRCQACGARVSWAKSVIALDARREAASLSGAHEAERDRCARWRDDEARRAAGTVAQTLASGSGPL